LVLETGNQNPEASDEKGKTGNTVPETENQNGKTGVFVAGFPNQIAEDRKRKRKTTFFD